MKAKKDVSNRAIFALIIAVSVVTIISTYFIVDSAMSVEMQDAPTTNEAQGKITILEEEPVVEVVEPITDGPQTAQATIEIIE